MVKLSSLAQLAIDAAGGLERWRRFEAVSARLSNGGVLWPLKQQPGVLDEVRVRAGLRAEWASHQPFGAPHLRTAFRPHRVAIETAAGETTEELLRPRDSFKGHALGTPWSRLQLAYFAGYAMWTYLNTPFLFASDGVETEEVGPWRENGETWRRLKVPFPTDIASHSTVQTFYFDAGAYSNGTTTRWRCRAGPRPRTTCTSTKSSRGFSSRPDAGCWDAGRTGRPSRSLPSSPSI